MKFDPRIKEGKRPLSLFDVDEAEKYLGKECYLTDDLTNFKNLDLADGELFRLAELINIWTEEELCFADKSNDFRYCLPLEWVETSDVRETKDLKKEIEDLRETVEALKSEINSLKSTIKTNSDRIHTMAQGAAA